MKFIEVGRIQIAVTISLVAEKPILLHVLADCDLIATHVGWIAAIWRGLTRVIAEILVKSFDVGCGRDYDLRA